MQRVGHIQVRVYGMNQIPPERSVHLDISMLSTILYVHHVHYSTVQNGTRCCFLFCFVLSPRALFDCDRIMTAETERELPVQVAHPNN